MNILQYLDRTWVSGFYDCWSFVREVYKTEIGVDLPVVCIDAEDLRLVVREFSANCARGRFSKVKVPEHLDVVLMGRNERAFHCGLYLKFPNEDRIIHNTKLSGVLCQTPRDLGRTIEILSYYRLNNGKNCIFPESVR